MGSERRELPVGRAASLSSEHTVYRPSDTPAVRLRRKGISEPPPAIDADLLAALRSALAEGVGVEELLARVRGEGRLWTHCTDALPTEAGRYEVAIFGESGPFATRGHYNGGEHGSSWTWVWPQTAGYVYAWRPEPRPAQFRPADRTFLESQGVPPEWLGAKED